MGQATDTGKQQVALLGHGALICTKFEVIVREGTRTRYLHENICWRYCFLLAFFIGVQLVVEMIAY
jgi:hypothetical protein